MFWLLSSVVPGIDSADCTPTGCITTGSTTGVAGRKSGPFWPQAASTQTDSGKAAGLLVEPLEKFVKAFKDSDPPDDLDEWHDEASDRLQATVDAFKKEQSLSALVGFSDSPIPDPPAEAKQRLRDAAEDVDACDGVAFLKPD